jgi:hypothetical protein
MKTLTRQAAIGELRQHMLAIADEDHSICQCAAERGILCHGFAQWSFDELKQRYWWLVERRPSIKRAELEHLANIWQVARQQVKGTQVACDTQALEHDTCKGWDEMDNPTVARYLQELSGEVVEVLPDSTG